MARAKAKADGGVSTTTPNSTVSTEKKSVQKTTSPKVGASPIAKKVRSVPKKSSSTGKTSKMLKPIATDDTVTPISLHTISQSGQKNARAIRLYDPDSFKLAILSPFRFPINHDVLIAQVARMAGVAFVVLGAIFTVFNMQFAVGAHGFITGVTELAQTSSYNCTDLLSPNYNADYCSGISAGTATTGTVDQTPDVDIVVDAPVPIHSMAPINIYVPNATVVVVHAYNKDLHEEVALGPAFSVSPDQWRYYWDTIAYPDGEYKLKVTVTNVYGTYTREDPDTVIVDNIADTTTSTNTTVLMTTDSTTTSTSTTATSTQTDSTVATSTTNPEVTVRIDETAPVHGNATVKTFVSGATQVKVMARPSGATTFGTLGYAIDKGAGEWRFVWYTTGFKNGTYELRSRALVNDLWYESPMFTTSILNATTSTSTSTTEITTTTIPTTTVATTTVPTISFTLSKVSPLSGGVDLFAVAPSAEFVEFYAQRKNTLTPYFLGLARKLSDGSWRFTWDTRSQANAEYALYARAKIYTLGTIESTRRVVSIYNAATTTYDAVQTAEVTELKALDTSLTRSIIEGPTSSSTTSGTNDTIVATDATTTYAPPPIHLTPIDAIVPTLQIEENIKPELAEQLAVFKKSIQTDLQQLAQAIRNGDVEAMQRIKDDIERLRKEAVTKLPISPERADIIGLIDEHLIKIVAEQEALAERNEQLIRERIGDAVLKDSDKDGISDYDEINLYQTDPFTADTDGDGFIDGTELASGYDPKNSAPETLIAYESPQDSGIVRDDLITIQSFTNIKKEPNEAEGQSTKNAAIISGKGLPNSYVTLYIYSTPVIVTIKTDAQGGWSYKFDKEIENGDHEVYVGLTDNAGRIVAKSSPFKFVKTAEAFTPIDTASAAALQTNDTEPSLISSHALLAIASIGVVALGLVLILLGVHVSRQRMIIPAT